MNTKEPQTFTPGPWAVLSKRNDFPNQVIIAERDNSGGRILAVVDKSDAQDVANARLIASAPDLLAALVALVDCPNLARARVRRILGAQAIAAIEKATGGR